MIETRGGRSVAAAELVRNFAHWREVGAREPVLVTHHGRETHIFMGLERYESLAGSTAPVPGADRTRELANRIHQGFILCRPDLVIDHVNPVALAMTKRWDRQIEGKMLLDALPEFGGTVMEAHIRHSLSTGEESAADIPSPFRDDAWLHCETFAFAGGIAMLLRDITADMQRHRLADAKLALLKAMRMHAGVGYLRLSTRGFIEATDACFCALIGLPEDKLAGVHLPDLIELPSRPQMREALDQVLRGEGDRKVQTRLLTNAGRVRPVAVGLARLHGTYGTEGAVLVITAMADAAVMDGAMNGPINVASDFPVVRARH